MRTKRTLALGMSFVMALGAATSIAGTVAAQDEPLEQVTFQLNWVPGGFHAGFALAREAGYYEDEGLFVHLVPGNGSATTAQLTAAGNVNLGNADAAPVTQLVAKGAPVKVIATLFQGSPIQITAKADSGITEISDLEGRSLAYPSGGSQAAQLPLVFAANGVDADAVELVPTPREALVPVLLEDQVDAIVGSMDFFGIQLADRGIETVDFPMYENGAPTVSTSIIGNEDWMAENPETTQKFVKASLRGWAEALENPDAAIEALAALFRNVDAEEAQKQLEATIPLYCANGAQYLGKATEEAWVNHEMVMRESGSIEEAVEPTDLYTYDYLPPDEELSPC